METEGALGNLRVEIETITASDLSGHAKLGALNEFLSLVTDARMVAATEIVDELTDYYEVELRAGDRRESRKCETKAIALAWMREFFQVNYDFDDHHLENSWAYKDGSGGGSTYRYMITFDEMGLENRILLDVWDAVNGKYKVYSETRKHRATEQRVAELEAENVKLREQIESIEAG